MAKSRDKRTSENKVWSELTKIEMITNQKGHRELTGSVSVDLDHVDIGSFVGSQALKASFLGIGRDTW